MRTAISPPQPRPAAVLKATRGFSRAGNLVRRNPGAEAGSGTGWAGRCPSGRRPGKPIFLPLPVSPPPHCHPPATALRGAQPTTSPCAVLGGGSVSLLSPPQNSGDLTALGETQVSISGCSFCSQDWRNKSSNPQASHTFGDSPPSTLNRR